MEHPAPADVGHAHVAGGHAGPRRRLTTRAWAQLVAVVGVTGVLFFPPFLELVHERDGNVVIHIEYARQIAATGTLFPGHFLFHVLTIAVHEASGLVVQLTWDQANVIVNLAARMVTAAVLWALVRRVLLPRRTRGAALVAMALPVALLFASAITMPTWHDGNTYLGYVPPNVYVSQTMVVLEPLALLTFCGLVATLGTDPARWRWSRVVGLGALAALSVLAKPSYAMVMVPAVGLVLLAQLVTRRGDGHLRRRILLALALFVPVGAVMVWIYLSTFLDIQADMSESAGSGIAVQPLAVMEYLQASVNPEHVQLWLAAKLLLSLAFPLAVALAFWRSARHDLRMQLAWLQLAVGLVFTYGLAETGYFSAGNFTWNGQIAVFILMIVSALFLLETSQHATGRRSVRRRQLVCWAVFALHVVGGFGPYLHPLVN